MHACFIFLLLQNFGESAIRKVVGEMIKDLGVALLRDRQPEARAMAIMSQFLVHPDVKKVINGLALTQLGCDRKELQLVNHIVGQLRLAITTHKNARNQESLQLYQCVLNLISTPREAKLQRATARMFGLSSRDGLRAAQVRAASRCVDIESGIADPEILFRHADRKDRSDWTAGQTMRDKAVECWTTKTRVTSCTKHTVTMPDGEEHPVHWLEETMDNFYQNFLKSGNHFYTTQLLIQHAPPGTTAKDVRQAFAQFGCTRVFAMARSTYFYMHLNDPARVAPALLAASSESFSLNAKVSQRPLIGQTAFANARPLFVKDVTTSACVCHHCHGFNLMFKAALKFKHWDDCCPQFAELVQDVKERAGLFSPSVQNLLDVLLCPRDPATDFHHKKCSYGDCKDCGWEDYMMGMTVEDEIEREGKVAEKVLVSFEAFENLTEGGSKGHETCSTTTRPALLKQAISPSEFARLFQGGVGAYQKHRYVLFAGNN